MNLFQRLRSFVLSLRLALRFCLFEEGYVLDLFGIHIKLPFLKRWAYDPFEIMESWGGSIHFNDMYVYLTWGRRSLFLHPIGQYSFRQESYLMPNGTYKLQRSLRDQAQAWSKGHVLPTEPRWTAVYQYKYVLKDGTVQHRNATVTADEMEWRWKWWKLRLPWPKKVRRSINVTFSDEVGEHTGSWKGGCIGCGYTLRPGETPVECLRRMERERVFD